MVIKRILSRNKSRCLVSGTQIAYEFNKYFSSNMFLFLGTVSVSEVLSPLVDLDPRKSDGYDLISNKVLRSVAPSIASCLTVFKKHYYYFNLILYNLHVIIIIIIEWTLNLQFYHTFMINNIIIISVSADDK